jgi:methylenetetrahydrofolate dehydrogenase (NAD+)
LVGFLANEDPASKKYAEWTAKSCQETGVDFHLKQVKKNELEKVIKEANLDRNVNGIMVYYPVFKNHLDIYLQNQVHQLKDVEGLGNTAMQSLYHNKRYMGSDKKSMKSMIPCTPLAIVKVRKKFEVLAGAKKIHIINNRSSSIWVNIKQVNRLVIA